MQELQDIFNLQTANRWSISTTDAETRIEKLKRLKQEVMSRREEIKLALYKDFKKPYPESELTEIHPVIDEINFAIKNLKKWMKPKKESTPIVLLGSKSQIIYEPKGVVLVLAPWNYPFSLLINPVVAAISAGNCIIARPSEKTPNTSLILQSIIESIFESNEVAVVLGQIETAQALLELPFDHIFFTGSINVGKIVMAAAAKNLSSVTLELGGKSPVIIDRDVDLELAVSRISWGKYLNAGQTCVAPDYVFIPEELKVRFIELFKSQVAQSYGETSVHRKESADFARLVDAQSFNRLTQKMLSEKNLIEGSDNSEENYLSHSLVETNMNSSLMEDEIFGPILPFMTYRNVDEAISYIRAHSKPLALYIFSKNKQFIERLKRETTSGGVGVNQVILHLANPYLPFGGVGFSGQGSYHGFYGFKAFSHEKSVLQQGRWSLISLYFPPYSTWMSQFAYKILRWLE